MSKRKPDELQSIRDDSAHKYFHQMLNMTDDDLDPYQYRLLGHYLRWAGHGGKLPEGLRETAKVTRMGINKVRSTRKELVGLGYLEVQEASDDDIKNGIPSVITVLDRWQENINRYAKPRIQSDTAPVSNPIQGSTETRIALDTAPVSNVTHSEELKEKQKREEYAPTFSMAVLPEMIAANEGLRIVTPSKGKSQSPEKAENPHPIPASPPPKDTEPSLQSRPRPRDRMAENIRAYQIIETFVKAWPEEWQDPTVHDKKWFRDQAESLAGATPPFTDEEITAATKHGISIKGAKFTFDDLGQALKELRMSRSKRNTSIYKPFEEPTRRRVTPEEFKAWQDKQADQEAANE